ncbi:cobalamin biosynthesis protein CobQ, partial [Rhodococcus sp. ADH]
LDLDVEFAPDKVLAQMTGTADGISVSGYEIHHGRVVRNGDRPLLEGSEGTPEGSVRGSVRGTHWHGLLESDDYRRSLLREIAVTGFVIAPDTSVAAVREQQLDLLADLVEQHLDQDLLEKLINGGAPRGLPVIASALDG